MLFSNDPNHSHLAPEALARAKSQLTAPPTLLARADAVIE
jgi:hypothetical protein